ncbi:MAG: hypothetical protein VYC40_01815 [Pseudomonadota bacterium]|nr:hypothetical protein [Pseudomonadota bacterium]
MGKLVVLIAVFAAGYLWGDIALSLAIDAWQDLAEAARPKLENL